MTRAAVMPAAPRDNDWAVQAQPLQRPRELEELRAPWLELWEQCGDATPFQRPEWVLGWCRHFGPPQLLSIAVWHGSRLLGLLPLFVHRQPENGVRCLRIIGDGISDYLTPLIVPGCERAVLRAVVDQLAAHQGAWDRVELRQLDAASPLLRMALPPQWAPELDLDAPCPILRLPPRPELLERLVARGLLQTIQYCRRRVARLGTLTYETATPANFEALFADFVALHSAHWARAGDPGVLANADVQAFHRDVARQLLDAGLLRLYVMTIEGQRVAVFYGFSSKQRTYYYLGGFDPAQPQLSLGNLIVAHAVERAIAEGCEAFDFLRGQEAYKFRWGAVERPTYRQRWHSPARIEIPAAGAAANLQDSALSTPH